MQELLDALGIYQCVLQLLELLRAMSSGFSHPFDLPEASGLNGCPVASGRTATCEEHYCRIAIQIRRSLVAGQVGQIADGADVVILMLPDSAAVAQVLLTDGLLEHVASSAVVVDMSSSVPAPASSRARRANAASP